MLKIIGEALLIVTRMDRAYAPGRDSHRPAHGADEGPRPRTAPRRLPAAGA